MTAPPIGISKRDIFIFLFKWKGTIFGWALFTFLMVTAFSYLLPQVYPATAKVIVERNRAPNLRSSVSYDGLESVEVMNNESAIIRSRPVMSAVVDAVEPHKRPQGDSGLSRFIRETLANMAELGLIAHLEPREKWIDALLRKVEPEAVVNSNVLEISYSDEEPEWSARIVNAVTDAYIAHHLEVYSSQGVTEFLRGQLEDAERELERLREATLGYKQDASISAVVDRRQQLVRELTSVREDLVEASQTRAELLTRFAPGHNSVRLAERNLSALRSSESEIQEKLATLEQQQAELDVLESRVQSQEATFLELQREYEAARLDAASNAKVINVRPIEYAAVPSKPWFPRLLVIFLSIPLGFGLSVSIALLREYLDHRVSDPDTAEEALGLPCVGSVPFLGRFSRQRPR
ncbi:MAG: GNVR domain-containing protein [Gammaproteobacteria bacterium]